jgi:hypothetical protein
MASIGECHVGPTPAVPGGGYPGLTWPRRPPHLSCTEAREAPGPPGAACLALAEP